MAPMRHFGWPDLLSLLLVLAAAAGLRAGYLFACCDRATIPGPLRVQQAPPTPHGADEDELQQLIRNVRESRSFVAQAPLSESEERTAHVAPAFPWLVGHLAMVAPEKQLEGLVRWIQAGLGALTAGLYFLFARRAFRSLIVGLVAGLLTAANPFSIIATATMGDATLASFALAGCLFLCSQAGEKGGALTCLLLGLSLGALGLVRASFLPFAFVGLVWFLIRGRTLPSAWLCGLLSFLGFLTALGPWAVRNFDAIGEPVPVVSSAYLHLWVGNNANATGGPMTERMLPPKASPESLREAKNQQARYALLAPEVVSEVRSRPAETLRRRLHAAIAYFVGDRWLTDGVLAEPTPVTVSEEDERPAIAVRLTRAVEQGHPVVLHLGLIGTLGLALLGWRWSFVWRRESIPAMLAVCWVPLPYVLSHAEALSGARLPLDGVLLCFAAFAVVALLPGGGAVMERKEPAPRERPAF